MTKARVTTVLCAAEIFGMAGFATFSALLPTFLSEWKLTNTEAGWVSGIYYAGYLLSVPVLTSLTDRVDPRRILLLGNALSGFAALGFGLVASGFWTALAFRFIAGMGLAGTYMPGLKVLSDHTEGPLQSRYVAFYTSSFSIGASASYFLSGEIATLADWRWSFGLASVGSLTAAILIVTMVPAAKVPAVGAETRMLLDFRPVLRTRNAMAYVIGYTAHVWELFSMRSWIVAFLAFSQSLQSSSSFGNITLIAAIVNLLGLPASLGGNELAVRFGRRRVVTLIMLVSAMLGCLIGFAAALPAYFVIALSLLYGITVMADSASLTAGAVAAAPAGHRGATLAVHSTLGFSAGFFGPLAIGAVLDLFGGGTLAWGLAFVTMGLGSLAGPIALRLLHGNSGKEGHRGTETQRGSSRK
jgi:MFS family permease